MKLDIIECIINDFKPQTEEHERIKMYLRIHKSDCKYYISNSSKYKERMMAIKSIYHSIKIDLLSDICRKIYS